MLIIIEKICSDELLTACRQQLAEAGWQSGKVTAGPLAISVKHNQQSMETPAMLALADLIRRTVSPCCRTTAWARCCRSATSA